MGPALCIAVTKRLRDVTVQVDLALDAGVTALVGPSGAGKSSLLRMVAGLLRPDEGTIRLGDTLLDDAARHRHLAPGRRQVSVVFQEYALFPHLSVAENVAYGLRARRVGGTERRRRVGEMLERLGIAALAGERPGHLSGGQRQRTALARALVLEPRALLLDEPLAALDVQTRAAVRHELRAVLADIAIPTVLVTHDYADALAFRRRIVILAEGRVVQDGAHEAILAHPRSRFVADFTGVNFFEGVLDAHDEAHAGRIQLPNGVDIYAATPAELRPGPVGVALRPWDIVLSVARPVGSARNVLVGRVGEVLPLGGRVRVVLTVDPALTNHRVVHAGAPSGERASQPALSLVVEITPDALAELNLRDGQTVYASFKATALTVGPL